MVTKFSLKVRTTCFNGLIPLSKKLFSSFVKLFLYRQPKLKYVRKYCRETFNWERLKEYRIHETVKRDRYSKKPTSNKNYTRVFPPKRFLNEKQLWLIRNTVFECTNIYFCSILLMFLYCFGNNNIPVFFSFLLIES